jgi:aminoglycoside phosphotransferase (APT) family kinase protein
VRRRGHTDGFASLAAPLGSALAYLARTDATEPFELAPVLEARYTQLQLGRARTRLGAPLADALRRQLEAAEPALAFGAVCLTHGDLGHRNVLCGRAGGRWRINGVIDWETATTGSPLVDIGSLFRYADRQDVAFRVEFERGYRDAGGELPTGWYLTARLLDVLELVTVLDEEAEVQALFDDCRRLIARLVEELAGG